MATTILFGSTSVRLRFLLGQTGLSSSSAGLIISTICDNEATPTVYAQSAGNIETISVLGTYSAPTAGKIRFAEVNATNHPTLYEFQIANGRFLVVNSNRMTISVSGAGLPATGIHYEIDLLGQARVFAVEGVAANQIMGGLVIGSQPPGSLARFVREIKDADILIQGEIVSAGADTAILDNNATTVCVGQSISIGEEGDPQRQTRFVTSFNPSTKQISLDQPWCVVPSANDDYQIKTHRNPLAGRYKVSLANSYGQAIGDTFDIVDELTELDGSDYRYTAKALEEAPTGGSGTIIVQPIAGITPRRVEGAKIQTFNGETYLAVVSGIDDQGNVINWTLLSNLEFVVESDDEVDLAVIADANITKTTTYFSVTIPPTANVIPEGRAAIGYKWSIRDATSKFVHMDGQLIVTRTALKD
jgi:hypothetical protein